MEGYIRKIYYFCNHTTTILYNASKDMKDIGKRIQEELEKQERSVSWFARQLSCDRSNVYRIFQRNNIDTQTLTRISRILQYNFFQELANDFASENNPTQTSQLSC